MPHFKALSSFNNDDDVLLSDDADRFGEHPSLLLPAAQSQDVATFHIPTDTSGAMPALRMPTDTSGAMPALRMPTDTSGAIPILRSSMAMPTSVIPLDADSSLPSFQAISYQHTSLPLQNISTTQSLVAALQATMDSRTTRPVLIIPAEMKRLPRTEGLLAPQQRMHLHWRHALVVTATFVVLLMTLLSLTPLGSGESGIALFDGAIQWAQAAQPSWNIMAHSPLITPTPPPAAPTAAPQTASVAAVAAAVLPTGSYVSIARQAAASAGIPADAFVRQIQQESSFNPYAVSPAGAVGIAQFLPSTAAGLGVNPYDPVSALYGAARYMARLSTQFGGNYAMGLAAYNAGSGAVQSAVNRGGANWLSFLPFETQNYVLKIMG